jgi:hypothetical protein
MVEVPGICYTSIAAPSHRFKGAGDGTAGATEGPGTLASFIAPFGIATDPNGNVYVADSGNHKIRFATPVGVVTTLAGSGSSGSIGHNLGWLRGYRTC